jgi:hypothetical protein
MTLDTDLYLDSTMGSDYEDSSEQEQEYDKDFNEQDQDYDETDKDSPEGCESDTGDDITMTTIVEVRGGSSEYHE